MIVLELHEADELPIIREASPPHVLRLAVVEAKHAAAPLPHILRIAVDIRAAAAFLLEFSRRLWAFFSIKEAGEWAHNYDGEQAAGVRFVVWDYQTRQSAPPPEFLTPAMYADIDENEQETNF
jgi:hypothetical protein